MEFNIKDKVKLKNPLSYLKTSENMPMLRPPDLVAIDEIGEIIAIKSPDTVEIKFRRGSFLIDTDKIEKTQILKFFIQSLLILLHIFSSP